MKSTNKFLFFILISIGPALASGSEPTLQSDWLEAVPGSAGQALGTEVRHVETLGSEGVLIDLSIPLENATNYERIEVISRETSAPMKQTQPHLWTEDYEKGNYGLRLYLKKHPQVGFRIRLQDNNRD